MHLSQSPGVGQDLGHFDSVSLLEQEFFFQKPPQQISHNQLWKGLWTLRLLASMVCILAEMRSSLLCLATRCTAEQFVVSHCFPKQAVAPPDLCCPWICPQNNEPAGLVPQHCPGRTCFPLLGSCLPDSSPAVGDRRGADLQGWVGT